MSLIQRNAVPIFILLAVVAAGVGALLFSESRASAEEPVGCNVSTVGISIFTTGTDTSGNTNHGDTINYQVILSIPELPEGDIACNYGGGTLTVTLPNGEERVVAGDAATGAIPTVQVGAPFTAPSVAYVIDQSDATDMELTANASYSGGTSDSVPEGQVKPEARGSISNTVRLNPPSIDIEMTPDEEGQLVYLGESANFEITVTNTGGFALSNVTVLAERAEDCARDGENSFPTLAVGGMESYRCSVQPGNNFINDVTAIGDVVGGVPEDQNQVQDSDSSPVQVETVLVDILIEPDLQRVRIGNEATFTVTVTIPGTTGLDNVSVSVPEAPDCDRPFGSLAAGAVENYTCTASADPEVEGSLPQGTTTVLASVSGEVTGLATLTDADQAVVEVFALDLFISIDPEEQTISQGDYAPFTITVGNYGDTVLSNVVVTTDTVPSCDSANIVDFLDQLGAGEEQSYTCESGSLTEDLTTIATVSATAPDDGPVSAEDSANVTILRPSTSLAVEEVSTSVLRLVVQTLKVTETNDGDSPLTNICVQLDPTGSILPLSTDSMMMEEGEAMEGEAMEGEAAEGEAMEGEGMEAEVTATDPCVTAEPGVMILTQESVEYVGGDYPNEAGEMGIMEVGETWEWRVVTVGIAGNYVGLADDALNMNFVAVGHGTDLLGGDVTFPGDAEELAEIAIPIVTR